MSKAVACALFVGALFVGALLAGGAAIRIVSAQDRTAQPGQPTQARVWIQNREDESVPVRLQGAPTVTIGPTSVVQARMVRQSWEYRSIRITAGPDLMNVLNNAGVDGWEATGLVLPNVAETVVLMKRPK
jgi:hypothetical protein